MSAADIVFYYVLPIAGCALELGMASAPIEALLNSEAKGALGSFNPFPPVLFLMTSVVWVINGLLLDNVYVFLINALLTIVNGYLSMRSYRLADSETAANIEYVILTYSTVAMCFGFGFLYGIQKDSVVEAYGWMCAAFNMCIFVPPLLLMREVVDTADSSKINAPFAIVGAISTAFWCIYSLLIPIYPLLVPHSFGFVLSLIHVTLTIVYPSKEKKCKDKPHSDRSTELVIADIPEETNF